MRLYKRGGYWWCSFPWAGTTIRRSTRCTARGAAMLVAQRWERERADPDHAAAAAATLEGAVGAFLATLRRRDKSAGTIRMYEQKCGTLLRLLGPDRPLVEITAVEVDKMIAAREAEGVAFDDDDNPTRFVTPNTIHKELVALRQVLKHARRRGEFRRDPRDVMPVGFSTKYQPRKVALTPDQAAKLCAALSPARAAFVAFILATSARRSEAFAQLLGDVNVHTGRVHLRGTKTEGSNREVIVPPFARPLLEFAVRHGGGRDGRLLRPWPNTLRGLARACRRLDIPRVTPNDLRRTLSTWLIEGGASTYVVSKVLGHKSTRMVETVYGQPRAEAVGELLERQTTALAPVRVVYVPGSYASQPGSTETETSDRESSQKADEKSENSGGPTGTRTRDLRINRPTSQDDSAAVLPSERAEASSPVRVAYVAQCVTGDVDADDAETPVTGSRWPASAPWLAAASRALCGLLEGGRGAP